MGTLLSLICVGSIVSIWYFWRKKPDKKYLIISVVALITSSFLYSLTPEYKKDLAEKEAESSNKAISKKEASESISKKIASESASRAESSKKQQNVVKDTKKETDKKVGSAPKTVAKSSTSKSKASAKKVSDKELLRRAKKLKYGMSYDEVKKIMKETPTTDNKDESGYQTLEYDNGKVILGFDENNKLNQGVEGAPQIAKQAQSSIKKAKEESSNNRERQLSFAKTFGQEPVEKLQKMVGIVYASERVGDSMYYMWNTGEKGVGKLVRVDDPQHFTTVYEYDENGQDGLLGRELYSGRTIINKPGTTYIYQ